MPAHATVAATISTIVSTTCNTSGFCTTVKLPASSVSFAATNQTVTWGTPNDTAFQNAANACPSPSNGISTLNSAGTTFPFTSRACVLIVPNGGPSGTGDYMFGTGVTLPTQTSFEVRAMGNSLKSGGPEQSGIRLVTAMPITILAVGQNNSYNATTPPPPTPPPNNNNQGGFQIYNVNFSDTSMNGSAVGGLLMNGVSEAVIGYCDFENFNGLQPGAPTSATVIDLSYGMKATTNYGVGGGLFNNNIVLLHDKGNNNSIWYDGSNGSQDGPIVLGGDVFPHNTVSSSPGGPPWGTGSQFATIFGSCIGIASNGPIRMYGTHFDAGGADQSNSPCVGSVTLYGGIISAKIESSGNGSPSPVPGVVAGGGSKFGPQSPAILATNFVWTPGSGGKASVTVSAIPNLTQAPTVGQSVGINMGTGCTTE